MCDTVSIAIDGPAAAGKSTVARKVAHALTYIYVDTGAMYRALTLKTIKEGADLSSEEEVLEVLMKCDIQFEQTDEGQLVFINGEEITKEIRTDEVTRNVSAVSSYPEVRIEMVNRQQKMIAGQNVVMDGRDIGTKVIPEADLKIFMVASVEERARRRHEENTRSGYESDLEVLMEEIKRRDDIDSTRTASPLVKAKDAVEVDTTSLSIDNVVEQILDLVNERVNSR
ncbi:cytidylate kinase [Salimicrobium jeotgali]|uniref:Cytidylate kinase n=1 Tax=Salimicrobium jeotgali TaxID=1230341 RepID=K2GC35_9BACI|nr:(d)CMP kinase [Salimicrobium jeotgali]AKG04396.1 cytidylate kinase [Salimicrobium jeotgali]EKE32588.1 cytidylate kinase [Salimicrobium jeotgali]MBM7695429.1 cytidylate kinase [Salimicrobium jeotgali]